MKALEHLHTLNKAALEKRGGLVMSLEVASKHRVSLHISPDDADAILGLLSALKRVREQRPSGNLRGVVIHALAPFEE